MIHSIKCNKPTFQSISFNSGFNVVVADRTKQAKDKDSRNGLGKSTLIEIMNFCLGGNKSETLSKKEVNDWTFTFEVDLKDKKYFVSRNTNKQKQSEVVIKGDCSKWEIKPKIDAIDNQKMSNSNWTEQLGKMVFDLKENKEDYKYVPKFRSLISYFMRRGGQSGAFLDPFRSSEKQPEYNKQISNSFLLGLGWEYASRLQVLKDRNKILTQIKQEANSGLISHMMGDMGELESRKIRLDEQVEQERKNLDTFKVHSQYSQIEQEVNSLTAAIHGHTNENIIDKKTIEQYENSLNQEEDANPKTINSIYREAGLIFPDSVNKDINDVLEFHKKIVSNRKDFLKSEIKRVKDKINQSENNIRELTSKRAELMTILKTHGALKEYTQLQKNHQNNVAELNDVSRRLKNLKKFDQGKRSWNIEKEQLLQQTQRDLYEREKQRREAISTFNSYSEKMYESFGTLSINALESGYKFDVKIERSGSHGISNMKIFCYDLMLAKLWAKRSKTPMFLIHDSLIFDGVDERQKALALQLAQSESEKHGFQYICTINSDAIPRNDFNKDFNFDSYVVKTLTDDREGGGLLGIRF